jgi:hypothetical protein
MKKINVSDNIAMPVFPKNKKTNANRYNNTHRLFGFPKRKHQVWYGTKKVQKRKMVSHIIRDGERANPILCDLAFSAFSFLDALGMNVYLYFLVLFITN